MMKTYICDVQVTEKRVRKQIEISTENIGRAHIMMYTKHNDPYFAFLGYKVKEEGKESS